MKILCLSYEYPPVGGGGAKVVSNILNGLMGKAHEVTLVTMHFRGLPFNERLGGLRILRVPCIRLKKEICYAIEMIPYLLVALPCLCASLLKNKYDVNHTHFIFPDGLLALVVKFLFGIPYIITAHGSDVPGYNPDRFSLLHKLLLPLWRLVAENAESIVCPSMFLENLVKVNSPRAKTDIIPNGIDVQRMRATQPRTKRILVVTRMFERKGVQHLLSALVGLETDYEVVIVGDGPYLPTLKEIARREGVNVIFTGFLENNGVRLQNLYEESSIFVFTSSAENFPIVLLEAMLAGLAIITSNTTGCVEVVGNTALTVIPGDVQGIKNALVKLTDDDDYRAELGKKARARVENHFSNGAVVTMYEDIYQRVIQ